MKSILNKLMELSRTAKIIATISSLAVVSALGGGIYYLNEETKKQEIISEIDEMIESISEDKLLIEYGNSVSSDVNDYLENTENVKFELKIENEEGKEYPAVGKYEGKITYKEQSKIFVVEVKDTTAPTFKNFTEEITLIVGEEKDLIEYFKVEDLSDFELIINDESVKFDTVGEYSVEVKAIDIYENEISKDTKIIITEENVTNNTTNSNGLVYETCSGNICTGTTDGWIPPDDFPVNGNQTYGRPENYTSTPGQVYVGIDPYTGGTIYKLYGVENPSFDNGTMHIENNPSYDGRYTYVPPTPDMIPMHSRGNTGMVFATLEEAQAWADTVGWDENSEWYGKTFVYITVSTDSTAEECDPWRVDAW